MNKFAKKSPNRKDGYTCLAGHRMDFQYEVKTYNNEIKILIIEEAIKDSAKAWDSTDKMPFIYAGEDITISIYICDSTFHTILVLAHNQHRQQVLVDARAHVRKQAEIDN